MVLGPEYLDRIKEEVSERKAKEKLGGIQQHGLIRDFLMTLAAAGAFIVVAAIFGFILHHIRY
ncbi:hypothetical protein PVOR_00185 [Paenibacillus vortex V453]|jgi:hypothetical protein|uniref:Uncharacterized protein n=1 Tax=Paenibacillus vortex V453 TaxID=715225 RepID=A0A2R9T1S1_9BACL|nr:MULTISPECIES: hypothetical protein [Paenibacillus]ANA79898.1 hypothetical protein A3958_07885 [Paenibacillus glucanolyticus]AVV56078.1 hypothetical protein C7121_07955 [Paenibacillus glucanolyticus]AWP30614.1 hypothetical protein B9D94_30165 [Paenibacillus sp. Cedars]EFU43605.1 hypothetical protein PVOR_00185 [Paenibacillus vortex V453]ETT38278.1 hypothetical protein C169_11727 [Paenibacillus sp. FSL R5-808]